MGNFKSNYIGKIENLKVELEIDISTGDEVRPRELKFEYISIFDEYANGIEFENIIKLIMEFIAQIEEKSIV